MPDINQQPGQLFLTHHSGSQTTQQAAHYPAVTRI
jgi:hypothetical protein